VSLKSWQPDSSGTNSTNLAMVSVPPLPAQSAVETLYQASIGPAGGTAAQYGYYYDAYQRRRLKAYPLAGVTDEYYYDLGHQLLVDRGSNSLTSSAPYPDDDVTVHALAGRSEGAGACRSRA
jgi:hypothetical protein